MTSKKTADLDSYRRHRGERSNIMWRALRNAFDDFGIPGAMRHMLMFMDQESFLAWGREEKIAPLEKVELAIKYAQLWRALQAMCGDDDRIMHHWLFTENKGYPTLFKGRSPIETILEDGEHVIESVISTLRIR